MSRATNFHIYDAIGRWLHAQKLARYTEATGTAPASAPLYKCGGRIPSTPDNAMVANIYSHSTERGDNGTPDVGIQFRYRAASLRTLLTVADAVYDALHDKSHLTLPGGVQLLHAKRTVTAAPEEDANHRWEQTDSYRLTLNPNY